MVCSAQPLNIIYSSSFIVSTHNLHNFNMSTKKKHIYQKKARESKFSSALLSRFFYDIEILGYSIKNAAIKYKINYSSAKALYKKMKDDGIDPEGIKDVQCSVDHNLNESRRCGFVEVTERKLEKHLTTIHQKGNLDEATTNRFLIISTVGWNFFSKENQFKDK